MPRECSEGRLTNSIRRLRFERAEMSQQELADRVGVTRQTIMVIEQGKHSPTLTTAFKIARALEASIETVFCWNVDPTECR